ncbi:MAG: family 10 glycosylhydrolase [Bifidobacteriaceae bacterium]|jgi:uncharacterized lipoprotein YddW (UPF0748 family)|nr:family 10 glycosylhydrolase [Bifidobacteriaceae bacterium]
MRIQKFGAVVWVILSIIVLSTLPYSTILPYSNSFANNKTVDNNLDLKQLYKYVQKSDGNFDYDKSQPIYQFKQNYYPNDYDPLIKLPKKYTQPNNQFRAAWIATVAHIDFALPKNGQDYKNEINQITNNLKSWNMNAAIWQIHPTMDAFYESRLNPWSQYLTGQQGKAPNFDFNPMQYLIDKTHQAGLEFHAWLNPYRVLGLPYTDGEILKATKLTQDQMISLSTAEKLQKLNQAGVLAKNNFGVLHPEYVMDYDEHLLLNAGIPEVRQFVNDTVKEIIEKYDVDAIHFDDYFYPYGKIGTVDIDTFHKYCTAPLNCPNNPTDSDLAAWRRNNNTKLVEIIGQTIKQYNKDNQKSIQFGISPMGIWEHKANDPRGSHTPISSSETYMYQVYADTYSWVKDQKIDYIIPQIYWPFQRDAAPHGELQNWWNSVANGSRTQLYIGLPDYKYTTNSKDSPDYEAFMNPQEIGNEIKFSQLNKNISGFAHYSYNHLLKNNLNRVSSEQKKFYDIKNQHIDYLKTNYYSQMANPVPKTWLSNNEIKPVTNATKQLNPQTGKTEITWQDSPQSHQYGRFYIIYKSSKQNYEVANRQIVDRIFNDKTSQDHQLTLDGNIHDEYYVAVTDQAGIETTSLITTMPSNINNKNNLNIVWSIIISVFIIIILIVLNWFLLIKKQLWQKIKFKTRQFYKNN